METNLKDVAAEEGRLGKSLAPLQRVRNKHTRDTHTNQRTMHKGIAEHAHVLDVVGVHEQELGEPRVEHPGGGVNNLFHNGGLAHLHGCSRQDLSG